VAKVGGRREILAHIENVQRSKGTQSLGSILKQGQQAVKKGSGGNTKVKIAINKGECMTTDLSAQSIKQGALKDRAFEKQERRGSTSC